MRKDPSWFVGAGGLLCLAISGGALYLSRHPEVANRFKPAANPQASEATAAEEITDDNSSEPGHFLSEQAIAQEYHRQADLPFNIAPAGTKNADKEEDEESPVPGHTPRNRLPGKITFAEETQDTSEFDLLFNAKDDSDKVIALNKTAGAGENDPRVMNYCAEDGEEKQEMAYAEEECEVNKPRERLQAIDEQAGSEDDADSEGDADGGVNVLDFIGNHKAIINLGLSRLGFPASFFMVEDCDRRGIVIQNPLLNLLADLYFQDAASSDESGPHFMNYCVDERAEKQQMPRAEEEAEVPPRRVGQIYSPSYGSGAYLGESWIFGGPVDPNDWREFIGTQDSETDSLCSENEPTFHPSWICFINGKLVNSFTSINPKAWRAFVREGIKKAESGIASKLSFAISDILPFVDDSGIGADESEPIDTIWPLNLLGQSFRGLLSRLDKDPNRRISELLIQSEDFTLPSFEVQADSTKKRQEDKPGRISPERVHGGIQ